MEAESLNYLQLTLLAVVQGLTEFLPISSSAHLLLPAQLFGWASQGLAFDVAVHVGTVVAVVVYLRQELIVLARDWLLSLVGRGQTEYSRLAWLLILATLPAALFGVFFNDWIEDYGRTGVVIAMASILFALLLYWADKTGRGQRTLTDVNWRDALIIGIAQAVALIPGTSRSGITMTAALFCHMNRREAARFSFLMSIPVILGSGLLLATEAHAEGAAELNWFALVFGATVAAVTAFICIHFFMRLIERIGFTPFVIYRIALGVLILAVQFLL